MNKNNKIEGKIKDDILLCHFIWKEKFYCINSDNTFKKNIIKNKL